jgi:iron complex outermembrane recepter protein
MTKIYNNLIFSVLCFIISAQMLNAQVVLKGKVQDADTGEELIGASVGVLGGGGSVTNYEGDFTIKVASLPVILKFSYTGFIEQSITVTDANQKLAVKLATNAIMIEEAVVKGQRIDNIQKADPRTIEKFDALAIKETASVNFYNGLGNMKGVDLTTASLGFTIINTRGFNSTSPVRSLQLIDGVDNQAPGLNFSLGNFLGSSDLDVQKVDLIVGANSTFYGPNAFNGVIAMDTKNPFLNKGFAVSLKTAERNLLEGAVRYADALKNKAGQEYFAYKLNWFGLRANDWEADNYDPVTGSKSGDIFFPAAKNPGRFDAVNIYGDEPFAGMDGRGSGLWSQQGTGLGIWHRRGYKETDVVDYNTRNMKANVALHFRLKPAQEYDSPELILSSSYGTGTTVYQGDNRFSLKGLQFFQNRLELRKKDTYFLRAYATNEDAGNSYDPYFTALKMLNYAKPNSTWTTDYLKWWTSPNLGKVYLGRMKDLGYPDIGDSTGVFDWMTKYQDSLASWHNLAADFADIRNPQVLSSNNFYEPGTARFDSLFQAITSRKSNSAEGGTRFYDKSALYHLVGEYTFHPTWTDKWIVGGSTRLYRPVSEGTIFSDSAGIKIRNAEVGIYTGGEKNIGKWKFNAALRLDKNQNFGLLATPAASVVYNPKENTYLRASFSSAIRNPTLSDQYLNFNVGRATLLGNLNGFDSLIAVESFNKYRNTQVRSDLKYSNIAPISPEKVKTFELGLRTTLFDRVYLDAGYYYSIYQDFIGYNIGVTVPFDTVILFEPYYDLVPNLNKLAVYRIAANSINTVTTQGFSVGLNYFFMDYYQLAGNYSWNRLNKTDIDDPIIPAFNTPEHKYNLSFSSRDLPLGLGSNKNVWGFNVTYKWIQGFSYEGSPQFTGDIPTYDLLDAQINTTIPRINTTIKIGASNVLNKKQFQTYGGPRIGRMAYVSMVYDFRKK